MLLVYKLEISKHDVFLFHILLSLFEGWGFLLGVFCWFCLGAFEFGFVLGFFS